MVPFTMTFTWTRPAAMAGTMTESCVLLHDTMVALVVPKRTVLEPWNPPKLLPVIVTTLPAAPLVGLSVVIAGGTGEVTRKFTALLATPLTVTVNPTAVLTGTFGTVATICVLLHEVTAAFVLPKFTVLVPCVAPKPEPASVTLAPGLPVLGVTELSLCGITRKFDGLLTRPPTVTVTG